MTSANGRLVDTALAFALENVAVRAVGDRRAAAQRRIRRRVRRSFLVGAIVGAFATAATHGFGGTSR